MRKYTLALLKAFYKLCHDKNNRTALKRISLGFAIAIEAGLEIKLSDATGGRSYTVDSPLFSEISGAFKEMLEKKWVEEVRMEDNEEYLSFLDYQDYILKSGLTGYSNPENLKNELKACWPLGNHWFCLTASGEEHARGDKVPVLPFTPDKVVETSMHEVENDEIPTEAEFNSLINFMFKHQEREFYLYVEYEKKINSYFEFAKNKNDILMNECEMFHYRNPPNSKNFVQISGGKAENEAQRKIIENSAMYKKMRVSLTEEKKRRLTIQEMIIRWKKPACIAVISLLIGGIAVPFTNKAIDVHLLNKDKKMRQIEKYNEEQKIANGLYPELLTIQGDIIAGKRKINAKRIEDYFKSGKFLSTDVHTQLSNLLLSISERNHKAAKAQVDDIINKVEKRYGCRKVDDENILIGNTMSADTGVPKKEAGL